MGENKNSGLRAMVHDGVWWGREGGSGQRCDSMWGNGGKGMMSSALRTLG